MHEVKKPIGKAGMQNLDVNTGIENMALNPSTIYQNILIPTAGPPMNSNGKLLISFESYLIFFTVTRTFLRKH